MNLESFFEDKKEDLYSERVDIETRRRTRLAVAAYAYEIINQPIMTDAEFDTLAKQIDLSVNTRRPELDKWFRENFELHTGMWIHKHPDKRRLDQLATNILSKR